MKMVKLVDTGQRNQTIVIVLEDKDKKEKNRQHIFDYRKQYNRKKRKESNILEVFNNDRK